MIQIKTLKANSVRGLPRHWEALHMDELGLVIYGSNGSGKSSVVDAAEYVLTNESSLFDRDRTGVNWSSASPHVRHGNPDILLEFTDGVTNYELRPNQDTTTFPPAVQSWLALARDTKFVLRRYMLLDFIEANPAPRYTTLEPFLNLGTYISFEEALHSWLNSLETEIASTNTRKNITVQNMRTIFGLEPTVPVSLEELFRILNAKLLEASLPKCSGPNDHDNLLKSISDELGDKDITERLEKLGDLKGQIQRLALPQDLAPLFQELINAQRDLDEKIAKAERLVLGDFLVQAKNLIDKNNLTSCPVCEQEIDAPTVLARLTARIEQDQLIINAKELAKKRKQSLLEQVRPLCSNTETFKKSWEDNLIVSFPQTYVDLHSFLNDLKKALEEKDTTITDIVGYEERLANQVTSHETIIKNLDEMIDQEGGGARRRLLLDTKSMLESLKGDLANLSLIGQQLKNQTAEQAIVSRLHNHSVEARKAAVGIVLNEVAALANTMYEQIHPDEGIAKSRLSVRDATRASVALTTDFDGQFENPLLHHSESHLDTLGLCYFLSLRRHAANQKPDFRILVLDDVMHSVDAAHRGRICQLVKDYFADHQIIVTTHDTYLYDRLRETLGGSKINYIRFTNWDIDRGPILADPCTDIDRICCEEERNKKGPDELAGACGRFMEMLLKRLTESLVVSIPAKFENSYTINDLWPQLCAKLKKHKEFSSIHTELINQIEKNRWVRNACGAHYNEESVPPAPEEIGELAKGLASLYNATHCDGCGSYILRQSNGDWRCSCRNDGLIYITK